MEQMITGTLKDVWSANTTTKDNKNYTSRLFWIETGDKYPAKAAFELFGDKCNLIDTFTVGQSISVSYNISSREYNGKAYTTLRAWRITSESADQSQPTPQPTTPTPQTTAQPESINDQILKIVGSLPESFAKKALAALKLDNAQAETELTKLYNEAKSEAGKQKINDLINLVNQRPEKPTEPDDLPF